MTTPTSNKLSEFFTWDEVTRSDTAARYGIRNDIPFELIPVIKYTAGMMDKVRAHLGKPVHINSWLRCLELNRVLLSKDTSDHIRGLAVDFTCPSFGTPLAICKELLHHQQNYQWKQLILEYTWVHISFYLPDEIRKPPETLTLLANKEYALGLTDKYGNVV